MGEEIDIELVREAFKSREALVDLEEISDPDRESSAHQDLNDYNDWVDKCIERAKDNSTPAPWKLMDGAQFKGGKRKDG